MNSLTKRGISLRLVKAGKTGMNGDTGKRTGHWKTTFAILCMAAALVVAPFDSYAQETAASEPRVLGVGTESTARLTRVIAASSDGTLVASGDTYGDGTITVWETANWKARFDLPRLKQPIEALGFSPDNRFIYVADLLGRVAVIDLVESREVRSIGGTRLWRLGRHGSVRSAFSANGELVAITKDPASRYWSPRTISVDVFSTLTKKRVQRIRIADEVFIAMLCFTPDAKSLIVGPYNGEVKAYDIATGQPKYSLDGIIATSGAITVSIPLNEIAVFDWKTIVRFESTTGSRRGVLAFRGEQPGGAHTSIEGVAIDDAGRLLATKDTSGRLRLWNRHSGEALCDLKTLPPGARALAFVPGKNLLVSTTGSSKLYVFDVSPYIPAQPVKP